MSENESDCDGIEEHEHARGRRERAGLLPRWACEYVKEEGDDPQAVASERTMAATSQMKRKLLPPLPATFTIQTISYTTASLSSQLPHLPSLTLPRFPNRVHRRVCNPRTHRRYQIPRSTLGYPFFENREEVRKGREWKEGVGVGGEEVERPIRFRGINRITGTVLQYIRGHSRLDNFYFI